MNNDRSKTADAKAQNGKAPTPETGTRISATTPAKPPPAPAGSKVSGASPPHPPPLFRKTDWLTFAITTAAVWIGYYLTLSPELTLEDSGELATGSMYAGIPHPPGYPVWTIYTWLWTVLLPVGNIAWRVALAHATSGAFAAGF